jgi:hypothetical protein
VLYDPEIVVDLCYGCHSWLHNTARSWNHPFVKKYGKDIGPWHFAIRVCMVYDEANRQYAATHAEDEPWGKK